MPGCVEIRAICVLDCVSSHVHVAQCPCGHLVTHRKHHDYSRDTSYPDSVATDVRTVALIVVCLDDEEKLCRAPTSVVAAAVAGATRRDET